MNFIYKNKKIILIIGVGILILLLLISLTVILTKKPATDSGSVQTGKTAGDQNNTEIQTGNNPLIDSQSLKKVEDSYQKKFKKQGVPAPTKPKYKFQYELDPALKDKQVMNFNQSVYAVTNCNLTTAPTTVSVYELKNEWTDKEAQEVAKVFDIDSPPYSMPADGGTIQYFFSNKVTNGFLELYKSSGAYTYHKVLDPLNQEITLLDALQKSSEALKKYQLSENLTSLPAETEPNYFVFSHLKFWGDFTMVDEDSIRSLGNNTVCQPSKAKNMNYIKMYIAKDGQIARLINQTRMATKKLSLSRQSLEMSLKEYGENPPLDPIVLPKDKVTTGKVTIDEAVIVYYDYGVVYSQKLYVPMYLTSGTAIAEDGTNVRVFTLFPTVSMNDLEEKGKTPEEIKAEELGMGGLKTQKQKVLDYATPTLPAPPYTGGCPGDTVDYTVSCTNTSGQSVCSAFLGIKPADDPNGICDSGCKSYTKEYTAADLAGGDPCLKMLKDNNIPTTQYQNYQQNNNLPTDKVSCILQGCPC